MKTGDPNGDGLPRWPRFRSDEGRVMILRDRPAIGGPDRLSALRVFDAVYAALRQAPAS